MALAAPLGSGGGSAQAAIITRPVNVTLNAANVDSYDLDVNGDGKSDFTFTAAYAPDPNLTVGFDTIDFPFGGNNAVVVDAQTGDGFPNVSRLGLGASVASTGLYSSSSDQGNLYFFTSLDPASGNFGGRSGYAGLKFDGAGGVLYGFAQVTVIALDAEAGQFDLTIGTVGYNDVAGQSVVIVPEPTTATTLVVGTVILTAGRRRRRFTPVA